MVGGVEGVDTVGRTGAMVDRYCNGAVYGADSEGVDGTVNG